MTASSKNRVTLLLGALFVTTLILAWWLPAAASTLVKLLLGLSFALASLSAIQKNRGLYQQGKITRAVLIRNTLLEVFGTLLVMLLAGLLGRQAAQLATNRIDNLLIKFLAGIGVGLLVGLGTGFLVKRVWGWLGLSL